MNRRSLLAGTLGLAAGSRAHLAAQGSTPTVSDRWEHPEWFTHPGDLTEQLGKPGHRVIALTSPDEFRAGHIPGAAQLDWSDLELVDSADATVESWIETVTGLLAMRGISSDMAVDIYDGGTFYAARLWWVLDILGHSTKAVLDGGLSAWIESGGEVETGPPVLVADFPPYNPEPNLESLATIEQVEEAVDSGSAVLVDAREQSEYKKGHIPGAVNVPFLQNAVPDSGGKWKSPTELHAMYGELGITPDQSIIPYCSTGVRSANTWFTLKALGYPAVRLFSGSFAEWSSNPSRPVEQGAT